MEEIATYEPHPDNPQWTLFKQTGNFSLHVRTFGFGSKLESYFLGLYKGRYDEARKMDIIMIDSLLKDKGLPPMIRKDQDNKEKKLNNQEEKQISQTEFLT